ncbi:hypothetical protein K090096B2_38190 [Bacteroides fragilis]
MRLGQAWGQGIFKSKVGNGSGRSLLLKTKGQITKYYPINKPINNLLNGYSQFETVSNGNYI